MATRPKKTDPPPLGAYLKELRGGMSIREAARRAGISEGRWRQVELGYQKVAAGVQVPVHPRPETVAAMCRAVSGDVRRGLELAGHDPAHHQSLMDPGVEMMDDDVRLGWFSDLPRAEREKLLNQLQRVHVDVEVRKAAGE